MSLSLMRKRRLGVAAWTCCGVLACGMVLALAIPGDGAGAQQPKTPEQLKAEEEKWIDEQVRVNGLSEVQTKRLDELIAQLSDPKHDTREQATLELLLLPSGTVRLLKQVSEDTSDLESQMRAHWVYSAIREGSPVAASYLSRASGLPINVVRTGLERGGVVLDEILQRTPPGRFGTDMRVWSALVGAAKSDEATARVMTLFRNAHQQQPHLVMYRGLLESKDAAKPESRAAMLTVVPVSPPDEALSLLEASINDTAGPVKIARRNLLKRITGSLDAKTVLSLWRAESVPLARRLALLDVLTLNGADEATRNEWVKIGSEEKDPALSEAFLSFACREGVSGIIDARIEAAGRSDRFFSLLCLAGNANSWRRVMAPTNDPASIRAAMGWLPYSSIEPGEQAALLLTLLDQGNAAVRDDAADVLSGFASPDVTTALLVRARANANDPAVSALGWHGHQLSAMGVVNPWNETWWPSLAADSQVRLLAWIGGAESTERLWGYMSGPDHVAMHLALAELATRRSDDRTARLARMIVRPDLGPVDPFDHDFERPIEREYQVRKDLREKVSKSEATQEQVQVIEATIGELLAVANHAGWRHDLRAGTAARGRSEVLLALYPDAAVNGDLAALVSRSPEKLLVEANMFSRLGLHSAVIDALLAAAKAGTVPSGMPVPSVLYSMAMSNHIERPTDLFAGLHRVNNDDLRQGIAEILMARGASESFLLSIEAAGQRSSKSGLRASLVFAATGSPDFSQAWIDRIRPRWTSGEGNELVVAAFAAAEAFLGGKVDQLESGMAGRDGLSNAALAARLGSRTGLIHLMNTVLEPGSLDLPNDAFASSATPHQIPMQLLKGAPKDMTVAQWRRYWRATRHAWMWDAATKMFVLADMPKAEQPSGGGK